MSTQMNRPENTGNAHNMHSKQASRTAGMVTSEFQNFLTDIEDLVKATHILTGEELAKAKAELNDRITQAKGSVEDVGSKVVNRAKKTASLSNKYAHEQPWQIIGGGTVIGFLLGYLLARRR